MTTLVALSIPADMPRQLSKEEILEAEECFSVFSKNGKLSINELGVALRSLGFSPSNQEVEDIIRDLGVQSLTFDRFKDILMGKELPGPSSAEEVREAFGIFDKLGSGTISARELRHLLMSTGEKLSEEEVNLMILEADVDEDGEINYEQFVQAMTEK